MTNKFTNVAEDVRLNIEICCSWIELYEKAK